MFAKGAICWSKTVALQYALPGYQDHHHHHHHHLVAQPVDDVEGVEEALRRLWVKEGSKVTVGISCKPYSRLSRVLTSLIDIWMILEDFYLAIVKQL